MKGFDITELQHYLNLLSTVANCLGSFNMLSNFVVAFFTASGQSLPCLAVANDARTTSRYCTKFS